MDDDGREAAVPRRVLRLALLDAGALELSRLGIEGGADGLLLSVAVGDVGCARSFLGSLELRDEGASPKVLIDGDLRVATALGLGCLLPEQGVATAEARRWIGDGRLIGRRVTTAAAAAAAGGADFVVIASAVHLQHARHQGEVLGSARHRSIVEATWLPVLALIGGAIAEASAAIVPGAHGVIVDAGDVDGIDAISPLFAWLRHKYAADEPRDAGDEPNRVGDHPNAVTAIVNGARKEFEHGTIVADLVHEEGWTGGSVSVTVNGVRVARHRFDETQLRDGDVVEIRAVGGGTLARA